MRSARLTRAAILAVVVAAFVLVAEMIRPEAGPAPATPSAAAPAVSFPAPDPIPWASVRWHAAADPFPRGDPTPLRIDGLATGNGLVVGWGRVEAHGRNQFNDMGAVFVSADGERWRSIALDDGVGPQDTSEPYGVSVGPLGLIAYGGVCCAVEERALWHSADGLRWTRVRVEGELDVRGSWIARVVGLSTGWVAVGNTGDRAAIWTSPDARTWRAVDAAAAGLGKGTVSDVAVADGRLVAVGTIDDAAGTHDGGVWVSDDGIEWSRAGAAEPSLTGPDETELWRVVPFAAGLFVVGNHGSHEERVRCEQLLGAVASLADQPPSPTALSCGWGREHHWLSPDASTWLRLPPLDPLPGQAPPPGIRLIEFRLLAAGGPGLINLGEDSRPPDGDSGLWVSADGSAWRPLDPVGQLQPSAVQTGLAVLGRTIIAVGEDGGAQPGPPLIWIGQIP